MHAMFLLYCSYAKFEYNRLLMLLGAAGIYAHGC